MADVDGRQPFQGRRPLAGRRTRGRAAAHALGPFVGFEGPDGAPRMYFEEALQFFRRVDAQRAAGYVLADLGDIARAQRLREPARERLGESLAHFRDARDAMGTAFALGR